MRFKRRWTLGGLMLIIALVAVMLAWYAHRAREFARVQAAADAERARLVARAKREIEQLYAEQAKVEEIVRRADEAIARAKEPRKASIKTIPEQVRSIVKLLDEQAKLEEKSNRSRAEVREKLRARLEKKRLEEASTKATVPLAEPLEQPR